MIDCRKVAEELLEYLDHELDEQTKKEIEKHIELCRMCFKVADFQQILRQQMRAKTFHSCPEEVRRRIEDLINRF